MGNTMRVLRCNQQMNMVAHQYISMNDGLIFLRGIKQVTFIAKIVFFYVKAWLSIVTTLYDVLRNTWYCKSRLSCHCPPPCGFR